MIVSCVYMYVCSSLWVQKSLTIFSGRERPLHDPVGGLLVVVDNEYNSINSGARFMASNSGLVTYYQGPLGSQILVHAVSTGCRGGGIFLGGWGGGL